MKKGANLDNYELETFDGEGFFRYVPEKARFRQAKQVCKNFRPKYYAKKEGKKTFYFNHREIMRKTGICFRTIKRYLETGKEIKGYKFYEYKGV